MSVKKAVVRQVDNSVMEYIKNIWWILMSTSILLVIIGLYVLLFPGATIELFAMMLGAILILSGAFGFVKSLINKNRSTSIGIAVGVFAFIIGIYILLYPVVFIEFIVFLFAIILLIKSIINLQMSVNVKGSTNSWMMISGILGIIAATFLFVSPAIGSLAIQITLGCFATLLGVLAIIDLVNIRTKVSKAIKK
jgi:Uncharacterized conserved protein